MVATTRPDGIQVGRPWSDVDLDDVLVQAEAPHEPTARVDAALAHLRRVRQQPERHVLAVDELGDVLVDALMSHPLADEPAADAQDHADLLALRARAEVARAWQLRGRGHAHTVSQDDFRRFHDLLFEADRTAAQALAAQPGHPAAAVTRLVVARGLGLPVEDLHARFDVAAQQAPTLYPAHLAMLIHLCAKWYGSDEAMFDFARRTSDAAPAGSCISTLFVHAHVEYWVGQIQALDGKGRIASMRAFLRMRRLRGEDADRVVRASDALLALPADAVQDQPRLPEAHQCLAWFISETDGDAARLAEHLRHSGRRIGLYPWYEEPDLFAQVLARSGTAG